MSAPDPSSEWLVQPRWLPTLRAAIGGAVIVSAVTALALAYPWRGLEIALVGLWGGYGAFLVWASRRERSGTRLEDDAVVVTSGGRTTRLTRADILDLRTDQPGRRAWRVQAVRRDGRVITLLAVPPAELERLRAWHVGGPTGGS
ncbi:hypothetical protein AVL62_11420 [Serinicoccus chungangensis]|uniref:Uncharacterized protein n=1 Tax=Serinicoccus chungangensis TaxID=767452 RepID=A0A0W8IA18_9MICO|nr:hypothetical protein [Serinicoccus chungangensis]KUG56750.1 hypothetical protein AVL62_11420 [Serinicoccus chungangensis]